MTTHDGAITTSAGALTEPNRTTWRFLAPSTVFFLILVAFVSALTAGFVQWDDDDLLFHNTPQHGLTIGDLRWMFTTSYSGHYQPLTWISYALDYRLWAYEAFGYHLTSLVCHVVASMAFYFVARGLLAFACGRFEDRASKPFNLAAAFAALLFAVHPLRVESVAWIAERRDVLAGAFYVLAVACYLRYAAGHRVPEWAGRRSRTSWYLGVLFCCILSLLSKASAVTLPLVLLVLDVYPLRRFGEPGLPGRRAVRLCVVEKIPLFLISILFGVRAIIAQQEAGALRGLTEHDLTARISQAFFGLVFYLWKTVVPTHLTPLYQLPAQGEIFAVRGLMSILILSLIIAAIFRWARRFPGIPAAFATYLIQVTPVLGFLQSGPQVVADRYSYLSCLGFAVLGGGALLRVLLRPRDSISGSRMAAARFIAVAIPLLLVAQTFRQCDVWQTPLSLWAHALRIHPASSIANVNYGDALAANGRHNWATEYFRSALDLDPRDAVAAAHLARSLQQLGDLENARRYFELALRLDSHRPADVLRLAHVLIDLRRPEWAVDLLRTRAHRHPDDLNAMSLLAELLATHPNENVRNGAEAIEWARKVVSGRTDSDGRDSLTLASALAEGGRFEEAVATAEEGRGRARRANDGALAAELDRRAGMFRERRAYRYGD